ncbi:MAG TPA: D-hexose-6-phosphate mutarotase [Hydrogenophaga sp.]|uniref:D-hexose-6-phosphate mutarotase n=1 Tax=Hydrogenophaga sp. TaxID=1904254 RepID=UPI002B96BC6C|nr:D-hexose-6-phosphate mutarotase [Hydrogenophaga sp.]HSX94148.1 D-hexose-6-phosphate mutarotase [Hydrogenophaga sp.]
MQRPDRPAPATVCPVAGPGGLPVLEVNNPLARAQVSLQGAQLLSFQPHGQPDWLFLSPRARFEPGQPIRGGVPVCWPWFGPDPEAQGRPAHGFARQRPWALRQHTDDSDGTTRLTLALNDDPSTRALWPHAFELRLDIRVGRTLRLSLSTRNTGDTAFTITQALHSYFAVDHIDTVRVLGLEGSGFIDQLPGAAARGEASGEPLRFHGRLDRIYQPVPARLQLLGAAGGRTLDLRSEGSRTAVLWNPGAELAATMSDLGPDTHQRFVCVETANAGDDTLRLPPGGQHRLTVEIAALAAGVLP